MSSNESSSTISTRSFSLPASEIPSFSPPKPLEDSRRPYGRSHSLYPEDDRTSTLSAFGLWQKQQFLSQISQISQEKQATLKQVQELEENLLVSMGEIEKLKKTLQDAKLEMEDHLGNIQLKSLMIKELAGLLQERDAMIQKLDSELSEMNAELKEKDRQIRELSDSSAQDSLLKSLEELIKGREEQLERLSNRYLDLEKENKMITLRCSDMSEMYESMKQKLRMKDELLIQALNDKQELVRQLSKIPLPDK